MHFNIIVKGRVHGVGFRNSATNMARHFGINGIVKNMRDGSVYLEIEGTVVANDLMISWCWQGPGTSRVDDVIVSESKVKGYDSFSITY